jgi:predicted nucleotidyltransferase component of viral defense system
MESLTDLHWEAVTEDMRFLLAHAGQQGFCSRFYMAGGTALALRKGHRKSIDLDFFSETDEVHYNTRVEIMRAFSALECQIIENTDGNLLMQARNTLIGFFSYGYRLMDSFLLVENVRMASMIDIGLMKLDALIGRGSRKDFYDLYVLSHDISFKDLLDAGKAKYPETRDFSMMALESMVLFDNADRDFQPELLIDLSWDQVRQYFIDQAKSIGQTWFG